MLDQHREIAVSPESFIFQVLSNVFAHKYISYQWQYDRIMGDLMHHLRIFADPALETVQQFYTRHPNFRGPSHIFLEQLSRAYLLRKGKLRFGEKTPNHANYLYLINDLIPDVQFLFLYRNPLDCICSLFHALKRSDRFKNQARFQVLFAAACLVRFNLEGMRRFAHSNVPVKQVEYAKLVTDPQTELEAICQFLGISFQAEMLAFQDANLILDLIPGVAAEHQNLKRKISSQQVGRYQNELKPLEVVLLRRFLSRELQGLPYDYDETRVTIPAGKWVLLHWHMIRYYLGLFQLEEKRFRWKNRVRYLFSLIRFWGKVEI